MIAAHNVILDLLMKNLERLITHTERHICECNIDQVIPATKVRDQRKQTDGYRLVFTRKALENCPKGTSFTATTTAITGEEQPDECKGRIFIVSEQKTVINLVFRHVSHGRQHKIEIQERFSCCFESDRSIFSYRNIILH